MVTYVDNRTVKIDGIITKRIDESWSPGDGEGGLDTCKNSPDTFYYVHIIERKWWSKVKGLFSKYYDDIYDVLFSTQPKRPMIPSGYKHRKRIGAIRTDSKSDILPFMQVSETFKIPGK